MPTQREVQRLLGFKSQNSAYRLINKLESQGILERDNTGRIRPTGNLFGHLRQLQSSIPAGFPSQADEDLVDTMTLDEWMITNREATYTAKVKGDSMKDAGIMPGDMVVIDRSRTASLGDIVVARLDQELTIKYLGKEGSKYCLIPANKKYSRFYPKEQLEIVGVVIGVCRKLHV
jgi:SOS regulatory protein LexA